MQELLGHQSSRTTVRYTHVSMKEPDRLRAGWIIEIGVLRRGSS
ncbi:hypothetical protein AB4124_23530 [Paenibacillus sp. 2KB_20]